MKHLSWLVIILIVSVGPALAGTSISPGDINFDDVIELLCLEDLVANGPQAIIMTESESADSIHYGLEPQWIYDACPIDEDIAWYFTSQDVPEPPRCYGAAKARKPTGITIVAVGVASAAWAQNFAILSDGSIHALPVMGEMGDYIEVSWEEFQRVVRPEFNLVCPEDARAGDAVWLQLTQEEAIRLGY